MNIRLRKFDFSASDPVYSTESLPSYHRLVTENCLGFKLITWRSKIKTKTLTGLGKSRSALMHAMQYKAFMMFQAKIFSLFPLPIRLAADQGEQPADFIQRLPGSEDAARDKSAPGHIGA